MNPLDADRNFFAALIAGDTGQLDALLTDDFVLIDVMVGSEIPRDALLPAIRSGQLQFESIEPADVRVRQYGSAAIVTGATQMRGRFAGQPFATHSRYTHVYVKQDGRWRLAAAQGTQIVTPQASSES